LGNEEFVGAVLAGRYRLDAFLRPGRFGDFWLGTRLVDGAPVAVKLLKVTLFADPKASRRFEREAKVLAHLRHPNLLRVLDHGTTEDGIAWVVTEPHSGRVLSDDIAELNLSLPRVCHIGAQVADVLALAHDKGIVHRGLEPDSVLVVAEPDDPDRVKVQDFGLAHIERSELAEDDDAPALTQVGERLGRCEYMAPEYIDDQTVDARTDLYVLGILLFEMLTGQPPFVGRAVQVMEKHATEAPYAPSELAAEVEVPPWLDALVLALLEKDPNDRPQSGAIVAKALRTQAYPVS
jgi:serine/threonine protein kinase